MKRYADTTAVDGIAPTIPSGRYCCLPGASGCGKTSTLRMIAGHELATAGQLLAAIGRTVHSGGQTTLYHRPLHGKANMPKPLIANFHPALQHVKAAAEQFKTADRWALLLRYIGNRIVPTLGPFRPPIVLPRTG